MCAPLMMAAAVGISAAGSLYSASEENAAGKAQQSFYDAEATASKQQGAIALQVGEQRDTLAQDQGAINSKIVSRNYAIQKASQIAAFAANGQSGSAGEAAVISDTIDKRALDEAAVSYNANAKSWEAKTNAAYENWTDLTQADQYTAAGRNARRAGAAKANATLLGGASQIAGMGLQYAEYSS